MSKGKWKAKYFLITCSEVKFHCSCFLFVCFFFLKTNAIERARNLIKFFCETRWKTGSLLNRWTYFAIQCRAWARLSLGLMTVMSDIWTTQPIVTIIMKIFLCSKFSRLAYFCKEAGNTCTKHWTVDNNICGENEQYSVKKPWSADGKLKFSKNCTVIKD